MFIYSLVKRLLSTCSVLRTESSSRDTEVNNTEADHSLPRKKNKQTWSDKRIVRNMHRLVKKSPPQDQEGGVEISAKSTKTSHPLLQPPAL